MVLWSIRTIFELTSMFCLFNASAQTPLISHQLVCQMIAMRSSSQLLLLTSSSKVHAWCQRPFSCNDKMYLRKHKFWRTQTHVFLRRPPYKNECLMHVLCTLTLLQGSPGGSGSDAHLSHHPHIVTHLFHEYHVAIPWFSMLLGGFCKTRQIEQY